MGQGCEDGGASAGKKDTEQKPNIDTEYNPKIGEGKPETRLTRRGG
jgi:hypothetical protein